MGKNGKRPAESESPSAKPRKPTDTFHPKKKKVREEVSLASEGMENEEAQERTMEESRALERKLKKERKKQMREEVVCTKLPDNTSVASLSSKEMKKMAQPVAEEELTPEERRIFERKLKKERKKEEKKLMREGRSDTMKAEPEKPSGCDLALRYLTSWAQKAQNWKFQKTRQTWLLLHMYDTQKISGDHFLVLLDYLEGLRGSARDLTVRKAESLLKENEKANAEDGSMLEVTERARQVIQLLS